MALACVLVLLLHCFSRARIVYGDSIVRLHNKLVIFNERTAEEIEVFDSQDRVVVRQSPRQLRLPTARRESCDAIFGFFETPMGFYLAYASKSTELTHIPLSGVHKVDKFEFVRVPRRQLQNMAGAIGRSPGVDAEPNPTDSLKRDQRKLEVLILETLGKQAFHFSKGDYAITERFDVNQRILQRRPQSVDNQRLNWKEADERFFWNRHCVSPLIDAKCDSFIVPMVSACVGSMTVSVNGTADSNPLANSAFCTVLLIARRSCKRQGPRYLMRGIDADGDVANFAESEQVVLPIGQHICTAPALPTKATEPPTVRTVAAKDAIGSSFVQIRGTLPLYWAQPDVWRLRPAIVQTKGVAANLLALARHLEKIIRAYLDIPKRMDSVQENEPLLRNNRPRWATKRAQSTSNDNSPMIYVVNLIDKCGVQGRLGRLWIRVLQMIAMRFGLRDQHFQEVTKRNSPLHQQYQQRSSLQDEITRCADLQRNNPQTGGGYSPVTASNSSLKAHQVRAASKLETAGMYNRDILWQQRFVPSSSPPSSSSSSITGTKESAPSLGVGDVSWTLLWFDYHQKCRNNNIAAVKELYEPLRPAVSDFYVSMGRSLSPTAAVPDLGTTAALTLRRKRHSKHPPHGGEYAPSRPFWRDYRQRSIIRTNCVDSLDRTNVVQSCISRWALLQQLKALRGLTGHRPSDVSMNSTNSGSVDSLRPFSFSNQQFVQQSSTIFFAGATDSNDADAAMTLARTEQEDAFRKMWSDHGDFLSRQYAGTRAMKRDVTMWGTRTRRGTMDDGLTFAKRYYLNNYRDRRKLQGLQLVIGLRKYHELPQYLEGGNRTK